MLRAIQRHRELFQDNVRELKRTKVGSLIFGNCNEFNICQASVKNALDHASLLSGVRNDIEYATCVHWCHDLRSNDHIARISHRLPTHSWQKEGESIAPIE